MGTSEGRVVRVRSALPLYFSETDDNVSLDKPTLKQLLDVSDATSSSDSLVGWYAVSATGELITESTVAVQNFFSMLNPHPVHLVMDASLTKPQLELSAFVVRPNSLAEGLIVPLYGIDVDAVTTDVDRIALDAMTMNKDSAAPGYCSSALTGEVDGFELSVDRLRAVLSAASKYVKDVQAGRKPFQADIIRTLSDALATVPMLDADTLDTVYNSSLQDLLMVSYLASLTRAQVALAERISTAVQSPAALLVQAKEKRDHSGAKSGGARR